MKKLLTTLAAVGTIAVASVAAPTSASAQWRGGWHHHGGWGGGGAVAAGVLGGLALGTIAANSYPYYGGYGYPAGAYAYGPGPGGCYLQRERFWDGWGWRIRRVRVCY
jgi:hypothetical protein